MVGDNPHADIAGGKSIGAITFQKIHHGVIVKNGPLALTSPLPFSDFKSFYSSQFLLIPDLYCLTIFLSYFNQISVQV